MAVRTTPSFPLITHSLTLSLSLLHTHTHTNTKTHYTYGPPLLSHTHVNWAYGPPLVALTGGATTTKKVLEKVSHPLTLPPLVTLHSL